MPSMGDPADEPTMSDRYQARIRALPADQIAARLDDRFQLLTGGGRMNLPRLADVGEVTVELIRSTAPPAGVEDAAAPLVAPAIANALFTWTGQRLRSLPLVGSP